MQASYFNQAKTELKNMIVRLASDRRKAGFSDKILHIGTTIAGKIDPLQWLEQQPHQVKIYWSNREKNFTAAGSGRVILLTQTGPVPDYSFVFRKMHQILSDSHPDLRFYGGARFAPRNVSEKIWQPFGTYFFIIPRFEIRLDDSGAVLICNIRDTESDLSGDEFGQLLNDLDRMTCLPTDQPGRSFRSISRRDFPAVHQWEKDVRGTLRALKANHLEKVVLARQTRFEFAEAVHPTLLMERLRKDNPHTYHFYVQPVRNCAFMGATPERLYMRYKQHLESEAIAGTRQRGKTPEEDTLLAEELAHDKKDLREHRWVSRLVKERMHALCGSVETLFQEEILKLSRMQHLYTRFSGNIQNGVSDSELFSALHPSAAVAGYPTATALKKIESVETFDRGWYAGPVGWISHDTAEVAVAIRSALVSDRHIFLYAGAGIVSGSDPQAEWNEIENKISNFTGFFEGP